MCMRTAIFATRDIIKIIHPLYVKRQCFTILNYRQVPFSVTMVFIQFNH